MADTEHEYKELAWVWTLPVSPVVDYHRAAEVLPVNGDSLDALERWFGLMEDEIDGVCHICGLHDV